MTYLKLFWSFFQIGLFSIGGGYAAMPLIEQHVVMTNNWLSASEFTDLITISQMTPGSISLNSATFVGLRVGGFLGAVVATLGSIAPSFIVVSILAFLYYRYRNVGSLKAVLEGLRPVVIALIGAAGVSICFSAFKGQSGIDIGNSIMFVGALICLRKLKMDPTHVLIGIGILSAAINLIH